MGTILLVGLGAVHPVMGQAPSVELSDTVWSFGEIMQGERIEKVIEVRNRGAVPLEIFRTAITCGCLKATLTGERIDPGATTRLTIVLDASRVSGRLSKSVSLFSNDPKRPRVSISVRGTIVPPWSTIPSSVDFGQFDEDERPRRSLRIAVRPGLVMDEPHVTVSDTRLRATLEPYGDVESDHGWIVEVAIVEKPPPGRLLWAVDVRARSGPKLRETVTVTGSVLGPVVVRPARIDFGALRAGSRKTVVLRVQKRKGAGPLVVEKIACPDRRISHRVTRGENDRWALIEVTATAPARGRLTGILHVLTTERRQRVLAIPYRGGVIP